MSLLLDHLWQSSAVLAAIALLTLFFRANGAHVRHALWTAASLKFLVPFALLNGLGHYFSTFLSRPLPQPPMVQAVYGATQPFSYDLFIASAAAPVRSSVCGICRIRRHASRRSRCRRSGP